MVTGGGGEEFFLQLGRAVSWKRGFLLSLCWDFLWKNGNVLSRLVSPCRTDCSHAICFAVRDSH
jgi:hypothetical protein